MKTSALPNVHIIPTMTKMFCSDLDGTLRVSDIPAIAAFRAGGGLFGIASGRGLMSLEAIAQERGFECDFLLADSTAVCLYGGEVLFSVSVEAELLAPIYEFLQERGNLLFAINREREAFHILTGRERWKMNGIPLTVAESASLGRFNQCSAMFEIEDTARAVTAELNMRFAGRVTAFQNGVCTDILRSGHDKSVGIAMLADRLDIPRENIFTIGDNFNDIPMLDAFRSFVVSSGNAKVKTHATESVVESVTEALTVIEKEDAF